MDTNKMAGEKTGIIERSYNDFFPIEESQIQLCNKTLWNQFHDLETEMIITKTGRRMFPSLNIKLSNLDPNADYCVFLELQLSDRCRFKFSSSVGWSPVGQEEIQSTHCIYMHPDSPSKGSRWMQEDMSFSRVKLTNTCSPPLGQIVLSSMHKYQPRIFIVKSSNPRSLGWGPTKMFVFPETQFVAVTAYQNEQITKLKINHNPFAKGFRENGKYCTKRKQTIEQPDSPASKKSTTPSPPPLPVHDTQLVSPLVPFRYAPYPFYGHQWWMGSVPWYYPYHLKNAEYQLETLNLSRKPRKMTDFSIDAIMKD